MWEEPAQTEGVLTAPNRRRPTSLPLLLIYPGPTFAHVCGDSELAPRQRVWRGRVLYGETAETCANPYRQKLAKGPSRGTWPFDSWVCVLPSGLPDPAAVLSPGHPAKSPGKLPNPPGKLTRQASKLTRQASKLTRQASKLTRQASKLTRQTHPAAFQTHPANSPGKLPNSPSKLPNSPSKLTRQTHPASFQTHLASFLTYLVI
jgi:hypothetical protein